MRKIWGILLVISCLLSGVCMAAPQQITATGVYVMGENDSPKIAKDAARQEAMRSAVEKAGVYVESYSRTQNMQLTADDIKVISGAVLKVLQEQAVPELSAGVWKYTVTLTCEVDTDKIDLKAMMDNRKELEKLQQERDALKKQNEELLGQYRKAQGQEKKDLEEKLESQYSLQDVFDRCATYIQQGEQRRAISELNKVISDTKVKDSPRAYAYYLRGRAYYERNMDTEALEDFDAASATPHNDNIYPVWRAYYYRGLIYSDREQWTLAYEELKTAWEASGRNDAEIEAAMQRARRHAYPAAQREGRHHNPSQGGGRRPNSGKDAINWEKVVSDVLIDVIRQAAKG